MLFNLDFSLWRSSLARNTKDGAGIRVLGIERSEGFSLSLFK